MAIVNRTDDSFYAGNRYSDLDAALGALDAAVAAGADIVDVGGVAAGTQGARVSVGDEIARVVPFLERARAAYPHLPLSLDTWRAPVARAAGGLGLDLVNDPWAGHDPELLDVAVGIGAGIVVSHTSGLPPGSEPQTRRDAADGDVLPDVLGTLAAGARRALGAGMPRERVVLDPTLDFGKTTAQSLLLLRHTRDIVSVGFPVLQALSRKDFIGESLDLPTEERLEGSLAATAVAAWLGATVFRTHDVGATRRVVDMVASVRGDRAPARAVRGLEQHSDSQATSR